MNINTDLTTYKPPFKVIVIDAMDAYYYADIMWTVEPKTIMETYETAIKLADEIFIEKNSRWGNLEKMNEYDAGYDVRVYDENNSCVYAVHIKYEDTGMTISKTKIE